MLSSEKYICTLPYCTDVIFELFISAAENGYLFEGDMVLSKDDIRDNLNGGVPVNNNAYGLKRSLHSRWPNGVVPYVFATSISKYYYSAEVN